MILSAIILSVVMQSVIIHSVVMLSVAAPSVFCKSNGAKQSTSEIFSYLFFDSKWRRDASHPVGLINIGVN